MPDPPDPSEDLAEIDLKAEREAFVRKIGKSPEAWLKEWRGASLPHTAANFATAYRAMLLEIR